jgi:hypothetical protein
MSSLDTLPYEVKVTLRNLWNHVADRLLGADDYEGTEHFFDVLTDKGSDDDDAEWREQIISALERQGYTIDHPKWNQP